MFQISKKAFDNLYNMNEKLIFLYKDTFFRYIFVKIWLSKFLTIKNVKNVSVPFGIFANKPL